MSLQPFELIWLNEREARANGVPMRYVDADFERHQTSPEEIVVLKPRGCFEGYRALFQAAPGRVLEIGIYEGGGVIGIAGLWPQAQIVGVDRRARSAALDGHIAAFGLTSRVTLHHGVWQDDVAAMQRIAGAEGAGWDFVIDDASHDYERSRRTFEIVFPYVKPGGVYLLEDWGWAHWKDWQGKNQYSGKKALSNLVFEFVMLAGSSPHLVDSVQVTSGAAVVRRAHSRQPLQSPMRLEEHYFSRGKKLNPI